MWKESTPLVEGRDIEVHAGDLTRVGVDAVLRASLGAAVVSKGKHKPLGGYYAFPANSSEEALKLPQGLRSPFRLSLMAHGSVRPSRVSAVESECLSYSESLLSAGRVHHPAASIMRYSRATTKPYIE